MDYGLLHDDLDSISNVQVDIHIYITEIAQEAEGEWDDNSVNTDPEEKAEDLPTSSQAGVSDPLISPFVTIRKRQRPDLTDIIHRELNACSGGTISINVCGTIALAEAVRSTLRKPRCMDIMKGEPSVVLYVEAFGNAWQVLVAVGKGSNLAYIDYILRRLIRHIMQQVNGYLNVYNYG